MDTLPAILQSKSDKRRSRGSFSILIAVLALAVPAAALYWIELPKSSTFTIAADRSQEVELDPPTAFLVHSNEPDPYSPSTTIRYDVPSATDVEILISDSQGRVVDAFRTSHEVPGRYAVTWNDPSSPNGLYFASLKGGGFETSQVLLLK